MSATEADSSRAVNRGSRGRGIGGGLAAPMVADAVTSNQIFDREAFPRADGETPVLLQVTST
ncbi:hypothetical protein Psi02_15380 [Planotetraspora silvatica]|uniref:Uncharacterized protein n=1 Tax=Planotetraspora silvatica TaxID=234614 RepID=A0A8J3UGF0_9ACTN|nr:hypothetical protein Psi02_15380 [Planotetraspora silvatica]